MSVIQAKLTRENIALVCKICLEQKTLSSDIDCMIQFQELDICMSIADILIKISSEGPKTEEGVVTPQGICFECLQQLQVTYVFLLKYEESKRVLNEFLAKAAKSDSDVVIVKSDTEEFTLRARKSLKRKKRKKKNVKVEDKQPEKNSRILHTCPICMKEFPALELRDHAHSHKALSKYLKIPDGMKVTPTTKFYTKRHLNNSKRSIFDNPDNLHKCPYCNLEFSVKDFRAHLDVHRTQCEYKCDSCERVFKRLNHLNTHKIKHLKEYPFKCEQCGKGFVIENNYECHMLTHTDEELPHECKFCLRRFSNPEHLHRHQIIHTENISYSVKYRVVRCHHCLKTFKDKDELKSHECVPVEQSPNTKFPCKSCDKVFRHASGLYNHNRNIHKLKGGKVLCSVCGKHVSNIYNHMMRHTGEKPFNCHLCEKRFISKPQLKQHLLVHSGLKPFVCSSCGKAFNNLYNLQVHERIHRGVRCHICEVCGKGFLEKSYLKKHMNVHSKQCDK